MEQKDILKYGEIQYLKGRLDELNKAIKTITDLSRSRKIDQRIEKYFQKLKKVDEVAYHLYMVELKSRTHAKERSKREIKDLLEEVLKFENLDQELIEKIKKQIDTY
jgi:hypothetical protein